MERLTVRVPATSANLGPGFDSLGVALSLCNDVTFSRAEKTGITGCPPEFCGEDNLALVAFRAAEKAAGADPCVVKIEITTRVPVARGLGSSATLLVAGAVGANELCSLGLSKQELFRIVNRLEGHPDNVAPALFGGFAASLVENGEPHTVPCPISPCWKFCAFIPDFETRTQDARAVLPATVSFADAARNGAHAAVLVAALSGEDPAALAAAQNDCLHEPYRRTLIPGFDEVGAAARQAGAVSFFLSGSGSTCMAIYTDPDFPARVAPLVAPLPHAWRVVPLTVDHEGARVI